MKILYIHNTIIDSEKANLIQVLSMCNAFVDNGIEVELALPNPTIIIQDINKYILNRFGIKVKFNILHFSSRFRNLKIQKYFGNKSIKNLLLNSNAEYVFTRTPNYIKMILDSKKKIIFESHNNLLHNRISFIDKYWKKKIIKYSNRNKFILFICISKNLSNFWLKMNIPKLKLLDLHDGFDIEAYKKIIKKNDARNKLKLPLNKKIVMYTGSLYPDREIENILWLAKQYSQILFYIIGGPNKLKDNYINISKSMHLENVIFTGHVPHKEISVYLFSADVLLALWSKKVPTINYCSPLKIFEYMASGKTIIAHDFITIREVLKDQEDAYLVNPSIKNHLVLSLDRALNKNSNQLGEKARKKVFHSFTWDIRAKKIIDIIK